MSLHLKSKDDIVSVITAIYLKYNPFFNVFIDTNPGASFYQNYIHQIYLMARLVFQRPIRVMVADEIGLGKTVEAIRILKHLKLVDQIKKVLIIVPPILLDQWIENDLKNLGIKPILIDRNNILELYEKAEQGLINEGIFIGSMDKLKLSTSDEVETTRYPYFEFINSVHWDLVIIDEAHKLSYIGTTPSLRYERLGSNICRDKAEHCVLLTATPHRGRTEDFLSRLVLLDKSFIPRPSELSRKVETLGLRTALFQLITDVIFFRRVKEDINKLENKEIFKSAHQYPVLIHVPEEIKKLQLRILDFATLGLDRYYVDPRLKGVRELLRKLIIKRAMSSEEALLNTFMRIGARREGVTEEELQRLSSKLEEYISGEESETEIDDEIEKFVETVSSFVDSTRAEELRKEIEDIIREVKRIINEGKNPKINALADIVELTLGKDLPEDLKETFKDIIGGRIIAFTEFRDTAHQIFTQLQRVLEKRIGNVPIRLVRRADEMKREYLTLANSAELSNYLSIIPTPDGNFIGFALLTSESKKYLSVFQRMLEDQRFATVILISTDVAAEGLNMQVANIVINYEITWSPMKRDQRIGRVWRLGQKRNVYIFDFHMGTDFERSILENFTIKIITIAEETGYTALQYKGIAFYIPHATASEEESYALRVVELEKFSESAVLDNVATALKRALSPEGLDVKILGEALTKLAIDIIRFTRQLRRELEALSRFRTGPDEVRREVKLLLGFENEDDVLKAAIYLLKLLSELGLAKVQDLGDITYVNGQRVNKRSLRDLVDVLSKIVGDYLNRPVNINEVDRPILMLVGGTNDFENAFLTFIVAEPKSKGESISKLLYVEPLLIVESKGYVKVLRGSELITKLHNMLPNATLSTIDNATFKAISSKYTAVANLLTQFVMEISRVLREKPTRYIHSGELSKLRQKSSSLIPNDIEPQIRLVENPLAVFISSPYITPQLRAEAKEERVPILTPTRSVSPEKKEKVKVVSENLVKTYFENLGYKVVKRSEYTPYDFELYDEEGNLVGYVEVKGHETNEPIVELSQNEFNFAQQNKDKYTVCVVTNALTSPRIQCVTFDELRKKGVYRIEIYKYIYRLDEGWQ